MFRGTPTSIRRRGKLKVPASHLAFNEILESCLQSRLTIPILNLWKRIKTS